MSFLKKEVTLPKLGVPKLPRRPSHPAPAAPRRGLPAVSRGSGVTGLEIGASQMIAAEARLTDGRIVARRTVVRDLPSGLVRDGVVLDAEALGEQLREMFAGTRLSRRVRVGLATPRTVLRVIDLPPLAEADISAALKLQAQDRIPMPLDRAVLDHQTIGLVDTPDGPRMRVIVVATERAAVDTLLDTLRRAHLKPAGIDLSVFAAIRAVSSAEPVPGPVLYAQLGDLVNLAIAESGVCHFTRQAPQGLAFVLQRLVDRRGGSLAEAQALLFAAAGGDLADAALAAGREGGALLGQVATELGSELRAAAEFYGTQAGATVSEGIVTGALAPLRGFVPALAEASGLELRCGEVQTVEGGALDDVDLRVAPVAVGLCVGSLER